MRHGYVSMTPLRLDLTDGAAMQQAKTQIRLEP
jgi:hypothetical protein